MRIKYYVGCLMGVLWRPRLGDTLTGLPGLVGGSTSSSSSSSSSSKQQNQLVIDIPENVC